MGLSPLSSHVVITKSNGGTVGGSAGVLVESGSLTGIDMESTAFETGYLFEPGTGQSVQFNHFTQAHADFNSLYGWHFAGTGTIYAFTCLDCESGSNAAFAPFKSLSGSGFQIDNGNTFTLTNPQVLNNGGLGIAVASAVTNVEIGGILSLPGAAATRIVTNNL